MAQASAAKEPTMEEILASIRRIIETNDTDNVAIFPADGDAPSGAADEPVTSTRTLTASPAPAISAASVRVDPVHRDGPPQEDGEQLVRPSMQSTPSRTISLADVAARLRSTAPGTATDVKAPSTGPRGVADPAGREADTTPSAVKADTESERTVPGDAPAAALLAARPSDASVSAAPPPLRWPEVRTSDTPMDPFASGPANEAASPVRTVGAPPPKATPEQEAGRPSSEPRDTAVSVVTPRASVAVHELVDAGALGALMSNTAGAQVAAAFDTLSTAVSRGPTRSFDEIAEDMLAPMLREWLDDNLPTLVERLVREEIERVARGSRR
jgi:uncharacterized protein